MGCFVSGVRQVASDRVLHGILVLLCCRFPLGPWSQSGLFLLLEYEDVRCIQSGLPKDISSCQLLKYEKTVDC